MSMTRDELKEQAKLDIRPQRLSDFVGQDNLKHNLAVLIGAARVRQEVLDHVLFYGPPGLGKTTLAMIIANEIGTNAHITAGPIIKRGEDLIGVLTKLAKGDILFIDEIHRLSREIEEVLYPAMEDNVLDVLVGKGNRTKTVRIPLAPFTLIGATTRRGMLTPPLSARFGATYRMDYYKLAALEEIVVRSARVLKVVIDKEGATAIAKRSRGTPRVANRLLRRSRDYAQFVYDGYITVQVVNEAMQLLGVDPLGLDWLDKKVLTTIIQKFDGGPVGLDTIAAAVSEEKDTLVDIVEPYLLQLGFLERTPRGRTATRAGYDHLGIEW